jgi:nucleotide-binding universal stress UspA family protein
MKILLAIDNSKYSAAAIEAVASRPWPPETIVRVLYTVKQSVAPAAGMWFNAAANLEQTCEALVKQAEQLTMDVADRLKSVGLAVETAVHSGNRRSIIVDEAKEWSADLIFIGSRGYTGIKKLLFGSLAQSVISHAPCSIELVRLPDDQAV